MFSKLWKFLSPRSVPQNGATSEPLQTPGVHESVGEDSIIASLDPWMLACAVGMMNGSAYGEIGSRGRLDFDLWFRCVEKSSWKSTGTNEANVRDALRSYAQKNQHKHMKQVMQEEQSRRGVPLSVVLGPGESIEIAIPLSIRKRQPGHE